MDYFFWDEILGRPSLLDGTPWDGQDPEEVLQPPEGVVSVIITVRELTRGPQPPL